MSVVSKILSLILNNSIVQWILGVLAMGLALFVGAKVEQRKGRKKAEREHAEADADMARDIIDRVDDADLSVHDDSDTGYRD
jgi:hypothetical protein